MESRRNQIRTPRGLARLLGPLALVVALGASGPPVAAQPADAESRLQALEESVAQIEGEIRDIKTTVSLLAVVPVPDIDAEELAPPPEDGPLIAADDLPPPEEVAWPADLALEEEAGGSSWSDSAAVAIVAILTFLVPFALGLLWGQSRRLARFGRWEYCTLEDPDEARLQRAGEEGWECLGMRAVGEAPGSAAIYSFKRPAPPRPREGGMRSLSVLFFALGAGALLLLLGGDLGAVIDPVTLAAIPAAALLFTLSHFTWRQIAQACRAALGSGRLEGPAAAQAALVVNVLDRYILGAGVVAFVVGLVIMLKNMDDPARIGPGMAMALLAILYAAVLSRFVVAPMGARLAQRQAGSQDDGDSRAGPGLTGVAGTVLIALMGLLPFLVLLASL